VCEAPAAARGNGEADWNCDAPCAANALRLVLRTQSRSSDSRRREFSHLLPRYQSVGRSVSRFGGISVHLDDPEPFHRTSTDKQVAGRVCRNGACFDTSDIGMLIAIDGGPSSRAAGALAKYHLVRARGGDGETRHVEIAIRGPSKPIRPGVRAKVRYS